MRNRAITAGEPIFDENGENVGHFDGDYSRVAADGGADSSDHISWLVLNETVSAELRGEYSLPGFISLEDGVAAGPEYFFIGQRPGHGREPHIDYSCENIWSAQIVGRKRWRLLPPDGGVLAAEVVAAGAAARDECGAVSAAGYEAVLEPGDILVWYPGWTHGTAAVDGASLALSKQFASPTPVRLLERHRAWFRAHSDRFGSFSHCGWW